MVDVLLNTEDVVVLGPPETVDVLVDIGPQGTRGSKIIVGSGEPNTLTSSGAIFGQLLILNDTYINVSPGSNYGYMYQYVSAPGGNTWIEILKISPAIYSSVKDVPFNSGEGSVTIPISEIATVSGLALESSRFNIQYKITGDNPISSSFVVPELSGTGVNLVIEFNAIEYDGGSWTEVSGNRDVHLFISIV
jgi:hypothetical protein